MGKEIIGKGKNREEKIGREKMGKGILGKEKIEGRNRE